MIYPKITIGGSEVSDLLDLNVNKATEKLSASSSFDGTLDNLAGKNKDKYHIGDEVLIYADKVSPPTTKIFTGILEDIKFSGKGINERINIVGRDYSARLMDRTVEPEIYNNLPAGSIVQDIINKYAPDITTTNVQSGAIIPRIRFNHTPVYNAIQQLAENSDYMFFVDVNKDLNFRDTNDLSTGSTFNSGNAIVGDFKTQRDTVFNQVWVYGDRYLDGYKETFTAGSPLGGSIFTLLYKPHNTEVTVSGAIIQPGEIYEMSYTNAGSLTKYLVSYDDAQIIFVSGTAQGENIPSSGNSVVVNYKRELPIVKVGDDEASKLQYGTRVKVIQDKQIKDPNTATMIMETNLAQSSNPITEGNLTLKGVCNFDAGQSINVNFPFNNINNETYQIIEAKYNFSTKNCLDETVLKVKLNGDLPKLDDTIKDILLELKKLKTGEMSDTDILTRFQYSTGSLSFVQSGIQIYTRQIGSSFVLGHYVTGSYCNGSEFTISGTYDAGLVSYFKFDNISSSTTLDYVTGLIGSVRSGLTTTTGIVSNCILCGSPGYITSSGNVFQVSGNTPFSISFWLKQNGSTAGQWIANSAHSDTLNNFGFYTYSGGSTLINYWAGSSVNSRLIGSKSPLNPGSWNNIILISEPGSSYYTVYVNGSRDRYTTTGPIKGKGLIQYFGAFPTDATHVGSWFSGLIDDYRIYNYPIHNLVGSIFNNYSPLEYISGADVYGSTYGVWSSGNGVLGSSSPGGSFACPPHFLGDFRGGSTLVYSE
jgi:hypothetical protein